jgi:transcription termination factor NusB
MAKAKVLADRISITSEVLTDENLEKVGILAPSILKLVDEYETDKVLYEVAGGEYNTFTVHGAVFKDGKSLGTIAEELMSLDDEAKEAKIKNILTAVLTKVNAIEEQINEYLENADDLSDDIEFLG